MDKLYAVRVNIGTADHTIAVLRETPEGSCVFVDDFGDWYVDTTKPNVRIGELDESSSGNLVFISDSLEQAEDVATGIYMMRKILRNWIDQ